MVSGAGHHGRLSPTVSSRPAPEGVGQCVGEGNHRCGHGHPPGHARLEDRSEPLFRRNTVMRHQPANIRVTTPSTNGHTPPPQGPTPTTEAPPHNQCRAAPHHAHLTAHTPISVRSVLGSKSALFHPRSPLCSRREVRPDGGGVVHQNRADPCTPTVVIADLTQCARSRLHGLCRAGGPIGGA